MTTKLMTHLFAATLALGLSACGGGSDAPAPAASPTPAPSTSPSPSPAPAPSPSPTPAPTPSPTPAPTPSPAPAPVASGGTASECFNAVFHTAGTTFKFDYAISGAATGKTVSNGSVKADASFNGNSGLVELTQDQTTTYTAPATLAAAGTVPTLSKFYFKLDGNIESEYGGTITTSVSAAGLSISSVTTVVYNPVVQDKRFTLALNGSTTYQTSAASTTAVSGFPGSQTTSSIARTITYMGQETITIPAGTFVACKFKESDKDGDQFVWHGKGNGAPLKMTSKASDNSSIVMELTAATLVNGKPL